MLAVLLVSLALSSAPGPSGHTRFDDWEEGAHEAGESAGYAGFGALAIAGLPGIVVAVVAGVASAVLLRDARNASGAGRVGSFVLLGAGIGAGILGALFLVTGGLGFLGMLFSPMLRGMLGTVGAGFLILGFASIVGIPLVCGCFLAAIPLANALPHNAYKGGGSDACLAIPGESHAPYDPPRPEPPHVDEAALERARLKREADTRSAERAKLVTALRDGDVERTRTLMVGLDVNDRSVAPSLLTWAGTPEVAALLWPLADEDHRQDGLLAAAKGGKPEVLRYLLSAGTWDPELLDEALTSTVSTARVEDVTGPGCRDKHGFATFKRPASPGVEVLELLLRHGAHANAADRCGITVLMRAVMGRWWDAADFLVKAGADLDAVDAGGRTLRELARASAEPGETPEELELHLRALGVPDEAG